MKTKYNYYQAVKEDVKQYINEHDVKVTTSNRDEVYDKLYDDMFICDSVTGNASGSYTFNTWQAEENLCHNLDLLGEALSEFGCDPDYMAKNGAEACDVTIRCYLLSQALSEVLDEVETEEEDEDSEEEDEGEELPTTTASEPQATAQEEPQSKRESHAAHLLATVKDHAAKVANRIGCKARRFGAASLLLLARILFFAVSVSSALAVMLGAALVIPEITPNGVAACLLLRVPIMFAVVGLWAFVWSWSLHHIMPACLLDYIQYGNR